MADAHETRTATVVFTDLVGSTAQRSALGDDVADDLRQRHDQIVGAATASAGGEVVKSTGDGSMMVFESAAGGVTAAAAMVESLAQHNRDAVHPILVRVGVATGDVSVDGGDLFGMPVVEAARLCDKAETEQILATDLTRMLCGADTGDFVSIGELELKGIDGPTSVCEVRWTAPPLVRTVPAPLRADPDDLFVGRDEALAELLAAWDTTRAGNAAMAVVSGEPGIGKTRLLSEFADRASADDGLVLYGRCEAGLDAAYQPIAEAFRRVLVDHPESALSKYIRSHTLELGPLLPSLADSPTLEGQNDDDARWKLFEVVRGGLEAVAHERPVVFVVDDMHWATQSTVQLIRHVVAATAGVPIMGVVSFRDTEDDALITDLLADLARVYSARVDLRGLDRSAISALLGSKQSVDLDSVAEATQGNPFFVRELARRDDGATAARSGVRDVVLSRVHEVGAGEAEVLRTAAVIGAAFELDLLESVLGRDVLDEVESCERAGLIRSVDAQPGVFRFVHDLVRETLHDELLGLRRARLHGRVADALVSIGPPLATPLRVARHLLAGALPGRSTDAITHVLAALDELRRQLAVGEAIALGQDAIDYATSDGSAALEALAELHIALAQPCFLDNQSDRGRTLAEQGALLAIDAGAAEVVARAAVTANMLAAAGRPVERTLTLAMRARSLVQDDPMWSGRLDAVIAYHRASTGGGASVAPEAWSAYEAATTLDDPYGITIAGMAVLHAEAASGRVDQMKGVARSLEPMRSRLTDFPWIGSLFPIHWDIVGGDRDAVDAAAAALAARPPTRSSQGDLAQLTGLLRLLDGRWDDAVRALEDLSVWANDDHNMALTQNGQLLAWAVEQGQERTMVDAVAAAAEENPGVPAFAAAHALFLMPDEPDAAIRLIETLSQDSFAVVPSDFIGPAALAFLADACGGLGLVEHAPALLDRLEPHCGNLIVVGTAVYVPGAADRYRAMLLGLLGDARMDDAYADALALEQAMRSPVLEARTRSCWARDLARRFGEGDAARAEEHAAVARTLAAELGMHGVLRDLDRAGL